ncbi:MAG: hypothetical protein WC647_07485 [Desulfomonilaceae bacterium]
MRKISATCLSVILVLGAFVNVVYPQGISIDQERLQRQIDELRRDVDELKTIVGTLQKASQKRDVGSHDTAQKKIAAPAKQDIDTLTPAEQEKIKAEVCEAVGQFFAQIDKALQMFDGSEAGAFMDKAVTQLQSTIDKYGQSKRLSKVISLAENLAYDTDWAVRLKSSSSGNADFIEYLNDYKEKYKKRCGRH